MNEEHSYIMRLTNEESVDFSRVADLLEDREDC
jgi:hypothetical protein